MINIKKGFFFNMILFFNLYQNIIGLCSVDYYCSQCSYCENVQDSCNYYNIFCKERVSLLSIEYKYSSFLRKEYINYYESISDNMNFCGETEFTLNDGKEITIFSSHNKIFKNDIYFHCHYIINAKTDSTVYASIKLLQNKDSNELRYLEFVISKIIKYSNKEKEEIDSINHS